MSFILKTFRKNPLYEKYHYIKGLKSHWAFLSFVFNRVGGFTLSEISTFDSIKMSFFLTLQLTDCVLWLLRQILMKILKPNLFLQIKHIWISFGSPLGGIPQTKQQNKTKTTFVGLLMAWQFLWSCYFARLPSLFKKILVVALSFHECIFFLTKQSLVFV